MSPRPPLPLAAVATLLVVAPLGARQQQTPPIFRTGTTVVTVDVSVRDGNRPVTDLVSNDFIVTDNGVPQTVEATPAQGVPVDVTLLLDTSGSVDEVLDGLKRQTRAAAHLLESPDRLRLLTVADAVTEVFPFQSPEVSLPLDSMHAGGGTAFYDAVAMTLIRRRPADRAELAVAFTDGDDTSSAIGLPRLTDIANRSEVVLYTFIVRTPDLVMRCTRQAMNPLLSEDGCGSPALSTIAKATGGGLFTISAGQHVPRGLEKVLAEFRTSYALRYTLHGVDPKGWHALAVKVQRPGSFTIRARKGYLGS